MPTGVTSIFQVGLAGNLWSERSTFEHDGITNMTVFYLFAHHAVVQITRRAKDDLVSIRAGRNRCRDRIYGILVPTGEFSVKGRCAMRAEASKRGTVELARLRL